MAVSLFSVIAIFVLCFLYVNMTPNFDSDEVESCTNEGDVIGHCDHPRYCYCSLTKWMCSFNVEQVLGKEKFGDLCDLCGESWDNMLICPKANMSVNLNLTFLLSMGNATSAALDIARRIDNPSNDTCNCSNTSNSNQSLCCQGWTGSNCSEDIDECQNDSVYVAECINTPGSFRCLCKAGWTDERCDQDIDECNETKRCGDRGFCVNTTGSFTCNCTTGWGGATCDYPIDIARRIEYWKDPKNQRKQLKTLNKTLLEIKANLTIDKKKLTSSRIKRISAPDPRQSAAIAGYLGAGFISFVFGLLLCLDLTRCFSGRLINVDREI